MPRTDRRVVPHRPPPSMLLERIRGHAHRAGALVTLVGILALAFALFVLCACQTIR